MTGMQFEDFHYLSQSGCFTVKGIYDDEQFKTTTEAMDVIGISIEVRTLILLPVLLLTTLNTHFQF